MRSYGQQRELSADEFQDSNGGQGGGGEGGEGDESQLDIKRSDIGHYTTDMLSQSGGPIRGYPNRADGFVWRPYWKMTIFAPNWKSSEFWKWLIKLLICIKCELAPKRVINKNKIKSAAILEIEAKQTEWQPFWFCTAAI